MTRRRPVWNDDQEAAVRVLRDAGLPNAVISERIGLTLTKFKYALHLSSLPRRCIRTQVTSRRFLSDDDLIELRALRDTEMTNAEIAQRMEVKESTIDHMVRLGKIPKRRPPETHIWRETRLEKLEQMLTEHPDLTYTQIGQHFGCSKNAIAGAVDRNGVNRKPPLAVVIEFPYNVCMWPHGHPNEPGFHFCGARPASGKPYCEMHAAIAYVRPKDSTENTSAVTS